MNTPTAHRPQEILVPQTEIKRLYALEYGHRIEVLCRLGGVFVGSLLLFAYTNHFSALLWSGVFLVVHLTYFLFLSTRQDDVTLQDCHIANVMFLMVVGSFIWMPSWMLVQEDRNMTLVGAALLASLLVHLVRRSETSLLIICGEVTVIVATMVILLIWLLPQIPNPIAVAGIVVSWFALLLYFAQSMLISRSRILAERAATAQAFQAQKLAAIGQLAGGVAHDFNNILTAISGNLDLYEVLTDELERDEVIGAAKLSSARAAKVARQLLIHARKAPADLVLVDANSPLASLRLLTNHLVPPNISFTITPLTAPASIRIDDDQFVTALMNIVVNAADAMPNGGQINLDVSEVDFPKEVAMAGGGTVPAGRYIKYDVTDIGPGIPKHLMKAVLEPFFTTKEAGKGTGLGLSMALTIAQSTGGGMQIETSDEGTSVAFFVPPVPTLQAA